MNFYYSIDGTVVAGPCTLSELTSYFELGMIPNTTQVCQEGAQVWQPLTTVLATVSPRPAQTAIAPEIIQRQTVHSSSPTDFNTTATKACPMCGEEILIAAKKCKHCGEFLDASLRATPSALTPTTVAVKKTPVILMMIFNIITAGFYTPYWFLTRRNWINSLRSNQKLDSGVFIFLIVMQPIYLLTNLISRAAAREIQELQSPDLVMHPLIIAGFLINLVLFITLLVQTFKVGRILKEHFNDHLGHKIYWSGILMFSFGVMYLQYKINRLELNEAPTRRASGTRSTGRN
jgi:hypothetical protein